MFWAVSPPPVTSVKMRVIHQVLAPGVKNGSDTQFGLEAFLAELQEKRGAGSLKSKAVERGWILQSQWAQTAGSVKTQ